MFERLIIVHIILRGIYNFFLYAYLTHHEFNKSKTHIPSPKPFSSLCPFLSERLLQSEWSHFHIQGWNGSDMDSLSVWATFGFFYLEFFSPFTHPSFLLPKSYSVQFSSVTQSDSLWSHELQHTRPPCPSPTPRVYPNSCPLSRWYHPTISSSVIPFSSCLRSFPTSGSFQVSQLF